MADNDRFEPSFQQVERAVREWIASSETVRIRQLLCAETPVLSVPDELLGRYPKDAREKESLSETMRDAVAKARADRHEAASMFCDEMLADPDYDIPYVRLAELLKQSGETELAIALLRYAATRCRRKSVVLSCAGEYLLLADKPRESVYAFAQSMAVMRGSPWSVRQPEEGTLLRLAEWLDVFEDVWGADWIRRRIWKTALAEEYACTFRDAAFRLSTSERQQIIGEVPLISRRLRRLFRRGHWWWVGMTSLLLWLHGGRQERTRRMLAQARGRRLAAKREANPPLPAPYESVAERVAELTIADGRAYHTMTMEQREQWLGPLGLDRLAISGERPEEHLAAAVELRVIGHQLNRAGGRELMLRVALRADVLAGGTRLRNIESSWDRIGDWLG